MDATHKFSVEMTQELDLPIAQCAILRVHENNPASRGGWCKSAKYAHLGTFDSQLTLDPMMDTPTDPRPEAAASALLLSGSYRPLTHRLET